MKLSVSNIAWGAEFDEIMYNIMKKNGYVGLEIAPTRIFPESPYSHLKEAEDWNDKLNQKEKFMISSMQSIWYGRDEKLFGSIEERKRLLDYTKKAIEFAEIIGCKNLVFGCPKNRNMPVDGDVKIAEDFFSKIGEYAIMHNTVIGMEANPKIYNTNFINTTEEAFLLVQKINNPGFKINLDIGTIIENKEDLNMVKGKVPLINHVHISEPRLKSIKRRELHAKLRDILVDENYEGFVSIEMGRVNELCEIESVMEYVSNVFEKQLWI